MDGRSSPCVAGTCHAQRERDRGCERGGWGGGGGGAERARERDSQRERESARERKRERERLLPLRTCQRFVVKKGSQNSGQSRANGEEIWEPVYILGTRLYHFSTLKYLNLTPGPDFEHGRLVRLRVASKEVPGLVKGCELLRERYL